MKKTIIHPRLAFVIGLGYSRMILTFEDFETTKLHIIIVPFFVIKVYKQQ